MEKKKFLDLEKLSNKNFRLTLNFYELNLINDAIQHYKIYIDERIDSLEVLEENREKLSLLLEYVHQFQKLFPNDEFVEEVIEKLHCEISMYGGQKWVIEDPNDKNKYVTAPESALRKQRTRDFLWYDGQKEKAKILNIKLSKIFDVITKNYTKKADT
ncbi:MAG: hypothetical protein J0M18_19515 [Ignavibacteria bacterium]|nr:hypothetical protein [Ignavibacteria bacterium]